MKAQEKLAFSLLCVGFSSAIDGFVKSFVDATRYGSISNFNDHDSWGDAQAFIGATLQGTSAFLMQFDMPFTDKKVRVTHSSLYCAESKPSNLFGTALVAPVLVDWVSDPDKISWRNFFKSQVGTPVANNFKCKDSSLLTFSDQFRLSSLLESWINRDVQNYGLVIYPDTDVVNAVSGPMSCRLIATYAPDGMDSCVDTAVLSIITSRVFGSNLNGRGGSARNYNNASLISEGPIFTGSTGLSGPGVYMTLQGHTDAKPFELHTSVEVPVQFAVSSVSQQTLTNFPVLLGCGLGSHLEAVVLRTETQDAFAVDSIGVEHNGQRWSTLSSTETTRLSSDPTKGSILVKFPLVLAASGLKAATITLTTSVCATGGEELRPSLKVILFGSGTEGTGTVVSDEFLLATNLVCGRQSMRIHGVDKQLGVLTAIQMRLTPVSDYGPQTLDVSGVTVTYGSIEYGTELPEDMVLVADEAFFAPLVERTPCVTSSWLTIDASPFSSDQTSVAGAVSLLGALIGSEEVAEERALSEVVRGSQALSRTSFGCGLGDLRRVRLRAQNTQPIKLRGVDVRYEGQQYRAKIPDSTWLSTDMSRGLPMVELELSSALPAGLLDPDSGKKTKQE